MLNYQTAEEKQISLCFPAPKIEKREGMNMPRESVCVYDGAVGVRGGGRRGTIQCRDSRDSTQEEEEDDE